MGSHKHKIAFLLIYLEIIEALLKFVFFYPEFICINTHFYSPERM